MFNLVAKVLATLMRKASQHGKMLMILSPIMSYLLTEGLTHV
jgi:hypothetical protein